MVNTWTAFAELAIPMRAVWSPWIWPWVAPEILAKASSAPDGGADRPITSRHEPTIAAASFAVLVAIVRLLELPLPSKPSASSASPQFQRVA